MEQHFKVLLIEDNPGDAFLIKFYLEEEPVGNQYELEHTEFLEEGLKKLDENTYDVILLDLGLPDSTGLDTLKKVLEHSPEELVIVLTGVTDEETGVKTVQMGAQDFLSKGSFDGRVLNSSIRFASERFKLNQKLKDYSNQLAKSKRQFEETQRIANLGYWEIDLAHETMDVTDELFALLGLNQEQFQDSLESFLQFVEAEDRNIFQQYIDAAQTNNQLQEFSFRMNDGSVKGEYVHCSCKPQYDDNDSLNRIVGIIRKSE